LAKIIKFVTNQFPKSQVMVKIMCPEL